MIIFNPEGGDLGRANVKPIRALEMQIIIPHIADILSELAASKLSDLPFKYAFELSSDQRQIAEFIILTSKLPPYVYWFETDGQKLFDMRGASGGIVTNLICYLVTK